MQTEQNLDTEDNEELLKCSICSEIIKPNSFGWKYGNNAQPINDGRCCDICNYKYVIPARLKQLS